MAASSSRSKAKGPEYKFECNPTVEPRGEHRATIVWLHDMDELIPESLQFVRSLELNNVKWICPSSRVQFLTTTWFKFGSDNKQDDREELDAPAKLVANILLAEPENVIKGVGGFGMGAAVALHFAANCALGHYPINPKVVFGINGWLSIAGSIKSSIESTVGAAARASSQSILLTHGTSDQVVPYEGGEEAAVTLREAGFGDILFVPFARLGPIGHEISLNVIDEVKNWLEEKLPLDVVHPNEFLP